MSLKHLSVLFSLVSIFQFNIISVLWKRRRKLVGLYGWMDFVVVLIETRLTDWRSHPSLQSETQCSPSCSSTLSLFKQRDYSEESSKASRKGLFNSSKGIKGGSCTSNTATDPRGLCQKLAYGLKSCQPDHTHDFIIVSQKHCQGAWHAELTLLRICCSFARWWSGQRDKLNESHRQDLNSGTHLESGAGRREVVWARDPNEKFIL